MDIVAKHVDADCHGVRIASLNEKSYKEKLWGHRPLTDFWRVGRGYQKKLESKGLYTMGDIAKCSINNEDLLFKMFGVNAELLIDHAWGIEPCTMKDVKSYKPSINSLGSGQVLHEPYDYAKTKLIVKEMIDLLTLDLVSKKKVAEGIVLTIGYDIDNLTDPKISSIYDGEITTDFYGRSVPKHAHGTIKFDYQTSSSEVIMKKILELFERIIDKRLLVRRINMAFMGVIDKDKAKNTKIIKQVDLFSLDDEELFEDKKEIQEKESKIQDVMIEIKKKYGKNAILKGMNLEDGGTTIERNNQIGGHKA
jgi:DNA polymerase V